MIGDDGVALLLLEGVLAQHMCLDARRSAELLGAGDLVRPRHAEADLYATVLHRCEWSILSPVRFALINEELMSGVARLPGVLAELTLRESRRSRSLALRLAILQVPNLETRLELLFWHLADRWGRRRGARVLLPLRLTQGLLAEMVGATRTSVNAALQQLASRGSVARERADMWTLPAEPPQQLA